MATISIDGNQLTVEVHGADKLWALKSRLTIPLKHVRGATADPGMTNEPKGFRGPVHTYPGSSSLEPSTRTARKSSGTSTTRAEQ